MTFRGMLSITYRTEALVNSPSAALETAAAMIVAAEEQGCDRNFHIEIRKFAHRDGETAITFEAWGDGPREHQSESDHRD